MKTGLLFFFISAQALAYLPGGKLENYSLKEQSNSRNYHISGAVGFVSSLNHIFSAENARIVIYNRADNTIDKEMFCNEMTYELDNSYVICIQGSKYLSLDLKVD